MYVHIYMYMCVRIYQGHSSHSSEIIMKRGRKILEAEELSDFNEHFHKHIREIACMNT